MHSIKEIFVVGNGPSSSHTIGPANACLYILNKYKNIKSIKVTLFGSLALTGKGHLTDYIIDLKLKDYPHKVIFDKKTIKAHPNTMEFEIIDTSNLKHLETILSIGGGSIKVSSEKETISKDTFPQNDMDSILSYCEKNNLSLADYVKKFDEKDCEEYVSYCMNVMKNAAFKSIEKDGDLPGPLHVKRKAKIMYESVMKIEDPLQKSNYDLLMVTAATAVAEANASGEEIVIAPTCGSCGVIPGVLAYLQARRASKQDIVNGMLVAGLIGQICKTNGSISGAEAGCQAEIGVACAMGAALIATARKMPNEKIAQAAEIALEHSLGLTCDPIQGFVQIPCIERNAMYALKAKSAYRLTKIIPSDTVKISFDDAVRTMKETGKDLPVGYRETAKKGLAKLFKK